MADFNDFRQVFSRVFDLSALALRVTMANSLTVIGSRAAPSAITTSGISLTAVSDAMMFVKGSGGAVIVTSNPRVASGTTVGQRLSLIGTDDTNTLELDDSNGLELNGACILKNGSRLELQWDGTVWGEVSRNDI